MKRSLLRLWRIMQPLKSGVIMPSKPRAVYLRWSNPSSIRQAICERGSSDPLELVLFLFLTCSVTCYSATIPPFFPPHALYAKSCLSLSNPRRTDTNSSIFRPAAQQSTRLRGVHGLTLHDEAHSAVPASMASAREAMVYPAGATATATAAGAEAEVAAPGLGGVHTMAAAATAPVAAAAAAHLPAKTVQS
eukprot:6209356-Pleurochrysis_carterae.AAC.3